jgi:hypothetical protein
MTIQCKCGNEVKFEDADAEYCLACGLTVFREQFDMALQARSHNNIGQRVHVEAALKEVAAEMVEHGFALRIYRPLEEAA